MFLRLQSITVTLEDPPQSRAGKLGDGARDIQRQIKMHAYACPLVHTHSWAQTARYPTETTGLPHLS